MQGFVAQDGFVPSVRKPRRSLCGARGAQPVGGRVAVVAQLQPQRVESLFGRSERLRDAGRFCLRYDRIIRDIRSHTHNKRTHRQTQRQTQKHREPLRTLQAPAGRGKILSEIGEDRLQIRSPTHNKRTHRPTQTNTDTHRHTQHGRARGMCRARRKKEGRELRAPGGIGRLHLRWDAVRYV